MAGLAPKLELPALVNMGWLHSEKRSSSTGDVAVSSEDPNRVAGGLDTPYFHRRMAAFWV
jgi:hypothetical protein